MDFKRPSKWKRRWRRLVIVGVLFTVGGLLAGYLWQWRRDGSVAAARPAGSFVTVEGRRVHYRLSGSGDCTFVLEAGLGDYSGNWGELEPALARLGRVFVYDRAGLGWSEPSPHPRTAGRIATELYTVLAAAHVPKPYVLVGHSFGGIVAVRLALDHPDDMAGLLLIDPAHPDQFQRLPAPPVAIVLAQQLMRAASFGLPQLLFKSDDPVQNQSNHMRATGEEFRCAMSGGADAWPRPLSLGRMPLVILTAGDSSRMPGDSPEARRAAWNTWHGLHEEIVAASSGDFRRHIVVEGAPHHIHRTYTGVVIQSASELLAHRKAQAP